MVEKDSLKEIVERTTIKFPRLIETGEAEYMFVYLANELDRCNIRYAPSSTKSVGSFLSNEGKPYSAPEEWGAKLTCHISEGLGSHVDFEFKEKEFSGMQFESMRAFMIPGYSLAEHAKGDIALIDKVRKGIESYFAKDTRKE